MEPLRVHNPATGQLIREVPAADGPAAEAALARARAAQPAWGALPFAEIAADAGVPDGVFQVVPGRGDAGAALTAAADMIFFTGSAATGKQVALAAAARLVPYVLELGGKSPMIVLADADLDRAAHAAV